MVFPLGMYSVATLAFGRVTRITFMDPIAHVMLWVAVTAWTLVAGSFLAQLIGKFRARRRIRNEADEALEEPLPG